MLFMSWCFMCWLVHRGAASGDRSRQPRTSCSPVSAHCRAAMLRYPASQPTAPLCRAPVRRHLETGEEAALPLHVVPASAALEVCHMGCPLEPVWDPCLHTCSYGSHVQHASQAGWSWMFCVACVPEQVPSGSVWPGWPPCTAQLLLAGLRHLFQPLWHLYLMQYGSQTVRAAVRSCMLGREKRKGRWGL